MESVENGLNLLQTIIGPWYKSLENPQDAQEKVLSSLLREYSKTEYGNTFHAAEINQISQYQTNFPIANYWQLLPYIAKVKDGKYQAFLSEPPDVFPHQSAHIHAQRSADYII